MTEAKPRLDQHLKLVDHVIHRHGYHHARGSLEYADLQQAGYLGLMKAIERFEPERGFSFATYACWWIRQGVIRELQNHGADVRVPVHLQEKRRKARLRQRAFCKSFDAPLPGSDDDRYSLHDVVAAEQAEPVPDVSRYLDVLSDRERRIIALRFWGDETLDVVAQDMGRTRERARQIEVAALAKMRKAATRTARVARATV